MKQVIRKSNNGANKLNFPKKSSTPSKIKRKTNGGVRRHKEYGTSKLEDDFARDFLDKLGIKYLRQFKAVDIGRYYDFAILLDENMSSGNMILVEIDGSYFHSDPRVVKEEEMNPMQKRNKRVDEYKDRWALMHGIPIIRFWEKDIRENPKMVMDELRKRLYIAEEKKILNENKNKRHVNKIK